MWGAQIRHISAAQISSGLTPCVQWGIAKLASLLPLPSNLNHAEPGAGGLCHGSQTERQRYLLGLGFEDSPTPLPSRGAAVEFLSRPDTGDK